MNKFQFAMNIYQGALGSKVEKNNYFKMLLRDLIYSSMTVPWTVTYDIIYIAIYNKQLYNGQEMTENSN